MRGRVGGIPPETIKFRKLRFQDMLWTMWMKRKNWNWVCIAEVINNPSLCPTTEKRKLSFEENPTKFQDYKGEPAQNCFLANTWEITRCGCFVLSIICRNAQNMAMLRQKSTTAQNQEHLKSWANKCSVFSSTKRFCPRNVDKSSL